jgi:hypothetical protein
MGASMPALDAGLKEKLNDTSGGAWRAVLGHPTLQPPPIRNSFCCDVAVLTYCGENGMSQVNK